MALVACGLLAWMWGVGKGPSGLGNSGWPGLAVYAVGVALVFTGLRFFGRAARA